MADRHTFVTDQIWPLVSSVQYVNTLTSQTNLYCNCNTGQCISTRYLTELFLGATQFWLVRLNPANSYFQK